MPYERRLIVEIAADPQRGVTRVDSPEQAASWAGSLAAAGPDLCQRHVQAVGRELLARTEPVREAAGRYAKRVGAVTSLAELDALLVTRASPRLQGDAKRFLSLGVTTLDHAEPLYTAAILTCLSFAEEIEGRPWSISHIERAAEAEPLLLRVVHLVDLLCRPDRDGGALATFGPAI